MSGCAGRGKRGYQAQAGDSGGGRPRQGGFPTMTFQAAGLSAIPQPRETSVDVGSPFVIGAERTETVIHPIVIVFHIAGYTPFETNAAPG